MFSRYYLVQSIVEEELQGRVEENCMSQLFCAAEMAHCTRRILRPGDVVIVAGKNTLKGDLA